MKFFNKFYLVLLFMLYILFYLFHVSLQAQIKQSTACIGLKG